MRFTCVFWTSHVWITCESLEKFLYTIGYSIVAKHISSRHRFVSEIKSCSENDIYKHYWVAYSIQKFLKWLTCDSHMWSSKNTCESHILCVSHGIIFTCETHVLSTCVSHVFHMWRVTCEKSHVKFPMWLFFTCDCFSHVKFHMCNFTCEISHVKFHRWNAWYCINKLYHNKWNITRSYTADAVWYRHPSGQPTWHDVTGRDRTWQDVTGRDMTWHDVTWRDVTWSDMTWHMMWYDVTGHVRTWQDMSGHDMAWNDVTWRDMTWHDVTWRGITWHDRTLRDIQ